MQTTPAPVPTHLITGFLGTGKTTLIQHLLASRPAGERWAVLVNEFGQMGIDQALLPQGEEVFVKEIAGGCMCCVAGLPTQVGLALLLKQAQPHRLLIEPTGLGHPSQIMQTLSSEPFSRQLALKASFCLIDPRFVDDEAIQTNTTFQDQLLISDVIVATKSDLASADQMQRFQHFIAPLAADRQLTTAEHGAIDLAFLNAERKPRMLFFPLAHSNAQTETLADTAPVWRRAGIRRNVARGFGVETATFTLSSDWRLDEVTFVRGISQLKGLLRVKGVFPNPDGHWLAINAVRDEFSVGQLLARTEARVEFIGREINWDEVEHHLSESLCACPSESEPC